MNSKKRLFAKCTLALAMVPFHAGASTAQAALEACADALVSELSISNGTAVNYRLDSANEGFDRKLRSPERISLYARDPQSSELVSRMDCIVSSKGRVVRLTDMPLDAEETGQQVSKAD
jgi:hypothetical protein